MPVVVRPKGRGRPPTHPIDRLKTRLWFMAVKDASGLPNGYAIELALDRKRLRRDDGGIVRPKKWDSYEAGEKVPEDLPGERNAIDQAETKYPGTARWIRSPLWEYLKEDARFDKRKIENDLRELEPGVVEILFESAGSTEGETPRQRPFTDESVGALIAIGSFDVLVVAILMTALSEAIASPALRDRALDLYAKCQAGVRALPVIGEFATELFAYVDARCKHWVFPSANQRLDFVIFSEEIRDADHMREVREGLRGLIKPERHE